MPDLVPMASSTPCNAKDTTTLIVDIIVLSSSLTEPKGTELREMSNNLLQAMLAKRTAAETEIARLQATNAQKSQQIARLEEQLKRNERHAVRRVHGM